MIFYDKNEGSLVFIINLFTKILYIDMSNN